MFDWIVIAVGGGLLAAGCATGSVVTKLLQRFVFKRKGKKEAVKEAVNAQDVEANRDSQGDGMEDLLFDEKLKLLVMKENLKKKLLQQKQLIQQLMGGSSGDKGQQQATAATGDGASVSMVAASVSGGSGDKISRADESKTKSILRKAKQDAEVEYFASELELSKWQN